MQLLRKKGNFDSTRILFLPVDAIAPNPDQPRRVFAQQEPGRAWPTQSRPSVCSNRSLYGALPKAAGNW